MDFSGYFAQACEANGIIGAAERSGDFERLHAMLVEFNRGVNLTAVTGEREAIIKHYADSLTALKYLPQRPDTLIDVGCGGGFPTLPLAIVRRDIAFTALDSTEKKLRFVDMAAKELSLGVKTLCARAEDAGRDPAHREAYGIVTARAVARLNVLCELCLPLARVGGVFIAMKGPSGLEEAREAKIAAAALGGEISETAQFTLADPFGGEEMERVIIVIEKVRPTPEGYPRQYGRIAKKPL